MMYFLRTRGCWYLSGHVPSAVLHVFRGLMDTAHDLVDLIRTARLLTLDIAVEPWHRRESGQARAARGDGASRAHEEHDARGDQDGAEEEEDRGEEGEHDARPDHEGRGQGH